MEAKNKMNKPGKDDKSSSVLKKLISAMSSFFAGFSRSDKSYVPVLKRIVLVLFILMVLYSLPFAMKKIIIAGKLGDVSASHSDSLLIRETQTKLKNELAVLNKKLEAKKPKSYYLIINTASNEFSLYKGDELVRKDKCSTGSYILLKQGDKQEWMFKTPKGEFKILGKTTSPVWKKPDWAFVEDGLPIPSANDPSRYEYGVLGDYSLNLGHGYLIHGTLYQRFLGLPVTHGCIRLNDENLELVYKSLSIGSKVYIY